jgi:hypothetical protein
VLELRLDRELLAALDELELDTVGHIEAAVERAPGWELEIVTERRAGLRLLLEHDDGDPVEALRELGEGLGPDDPGLRTDLDVAALDDGGTELTGTALLSAPTAAGAVAADGEPFGPEAEELRELMAEHVTGELVVGFAGEVISHDADLEDGRTLTWELPPDEQVQVNARAAAPSRLDEVLLAAGAGAVLVGLVVALALWWRSRRRASRGA